MVNRRPPTRKRSRTAKLPDMEPPSPSTLETLVAHIQALSGSPSEVANLHSILRQSEDALRSQGAALGPLLSLLDPAAHSLGYLYLLDAYSTGQISREHATELILLISDFINSCASEQIRLAPEKFISVCRIFNDKIMQLEAPIRGIAPLLSAIRKLQTSTEHLTAIHSDFLLLCLLAKCYRATITVLDDEILEFDKPRDLFLYCYYGGMANIGLKRFAKALEYFHIVVTAPSSLNAITVESYKKYVLVSLIHNGQVPPFPKYTSSSVQRSLKNFCQHYCDLANCYSNGAFLEIDACIATNQEKFESDNNLGLVKQVKSSLYKRNIQRLTQTYLTLSLEDIANAVQLNSSKEAEMHVLRMIQDEEIFATINQKDGMVSFHEDPEQYKSCSMIGHLDGRIQRFIALSKKLSSIDEQMSCDSAYLMKVGREKTKLELDDFDPIAHKFF